MNDDTENNTGDREQHDAMALLRDLSTRMERMERRQAEPYPHLQRTAQEAQRQPQHVVMRERAQEPQTNADSTEWQGTKFTNVGIVAATGIVAALAVWQGEYDVAQTIFGMGLAVVGGVQVGYTASRSYTKAKTGKVR